MLDPDPDPNPESIIPDLKLCTTVSVTQYRNAVTSLLDMVG
jgi:hypothetical protein